jgi:hypothetical protein
MSIRSIKINEDLRGYTPAPGWTVSDDRTAAVWERGLQEFLRSPFDALQEVLHELGVRP